MLPSCMLTFQSRFGFDRMAAALHRHDDQAACRRRRDGASRSSRRGFPPIASRRWRKSRRRMPRSSSTMAASNFAAIPCLNDSEAGMDVIRQLVLRELQGWIWL